MTCPLMRSRCERNPNKATTRVSISRPDTYERLPRTCEEINCEQQPVHTFGLGVTLKPTAMGYDGTMRLQPNAGNRATVTRAFLEKQMTENFG